MLREQVRPGNRLVVRLSGSVVSVVLLDLLVPLSIPLQVTLSAIHINHGISPHAGQLDPFAIIYATREVFHSRSSG